VISVSLHDSILNLLDIKEENIIFDEEFCIDEVKKEQVCKVFKATLSYVPDACFNCGHVFDESFIKHGYKASDITMPNVSNFKATLRLRKQRYLCKHCSSTFILKTNLVDQNCFISKKTKVAVALQGKMKISEKDIATLHNVSHNTVSRVINSFYDIHKPNKHMLPKHLSFDEFKSVKDVSGAMSFIFCNSANGRIVDIVEDRKLNALIKYFCSFTKKARRMVQTIVIDIYKPYMSLIKKLFPNAKVIIDRFHAVQLFTRSLNTTRVKVMNTFERNTNEYKKLKRFWKILLKKRKDVDHIKFKYNYSFRKCMTEGEILEYLLSISEVIETAYNIYQSIRYAFEVKDFNRLSSTVKSTYNHLSDSVATSLKTCKKYLGFMQNAVTFKFSNGVLEGINNKIKVVKRIAFGYRCFINLKNRIMIMQNLVHIKTA